MSKVSKQEQLENFEALYPRTFIEHTSYGYGELVRGKQEATHIRRLTENERQIVEDMERLLFSPEREA